MPSIEQYNKTYSTVEHQSLILTHDDILSSEKHKLHNSCYRSISALVILLFLLILYS